MKRIRLQWLLVVGTVCGLLAGTSVWAEPIEPGSRLPASMPWQLDKLSRAPDYEWVDQDGPVRSLLYQGQEYRGKPTQVFAYYATPGSIMGRKDEAGLPAVVLVHGGGGTAFREWAELWARKGYAAIAMDLAGHRPLEGQNAHDPKNRTRLDNGGPDQSDEEKFGSIDLPPQQQWPYHAVANVLLAHSLIRSFPEIDSQRTAVTGISWGGYLTCIVAGVDSRFRAAVPVYGCGHLSENSIWLDRFAKMTPEQRDRWVKLWDPAQYLPAVSMPILMVNGTNDFAYPLDSYMKSYEDITAEKKLCITVNMPHSHPAGWAPQEIFLFIDHHLRGGPALPTLGPLQMEAGQLRVAYESVVPISEAALHWTKGTEPVNQRQWETLAGDIDGRQLVVDSPPADATAWFVTAKDERGAIVSTEVNFVSTETSSASDEQPR